MAFEAGMIMTLNLLFLGHHVVKYRGHLQAIIAPARSFVQAFGFHFSKRMEVSPEDGRDAEVAQALWDVRGRAYRHATELFIHQSAIAVTGLSYNFYTEPTLSSLSQLCLMIFVYMHHCLCLERAIWKGRNLRTLYIIYYTGFGLTVLASCWQQETQERAMSKQVFNVSARILFSVIFIDTATACPAQAAISLAEIGQYASASHVAFGDVVVFAWVQVLVALGLVALSAILEYWVTCHVSAHLDTKSMLSSFRRMLRGVCDGEVLLDDEMKIQEDTGCLKHLLMHAGSFKGKDFEELLLPSEVPQFRDFMNQSKRDALQPEEQNGTPPCLRISLKGASTFRVGVDLWHVPMCRKDGTLHVLALREDSDTRAPREDHEPDREPQPLPQMIPRMSSENGPERLCGAVLEVSPPRGQVGPEVGRGNHVAEVVAVVASEFSRAPRYDPLRGHLQQLVRRLDAADRKTQPDAAEPDRKTLEDVEQAHLSFMRQPQSSHLSMPSLRRLIRPSEWETVRSKLKEVGCGHRDGSDHTDTMEMHLLDDAKQPLIAQVQVSAYRPPRGTVSKRKGGTDGIGEDTLIVTCGSVFNSIM
ncbi:unnamed protein product [Durusdinium trenchii]|uniref:Uncharacterized protein n=1 Tax=Durusdinium trenchii TaxID=1381693 RepID=A0ABP0SWQ0_9DINO